jgi:hypothetical protein
VAAAALLRLIGLDYGLPHTYNADEPHLINLAVSFGGGSLAPYSFKYPTLWPYLLFVCYGLFFLVWSVLGLRRGLVDFIGLYAWKPTAFYLIGRLLSAASTLGGAWLIGRVEPWAGALLAFAPVLVETAHAAKPDGLMFLFSSIGWYAGLQVLKGGKRKWSLLAGAALGAAASTQYTAAPALLLLPLAHGRKWKELGRSLGAAAAAFFLASPYILLDFPRFWSDLSAMSYMTLFRYQAQADIARDVALNVWGFAGEGSVAGLLAMIGLARLALKDPRLGAFLGVPALTHAVLIALSPDGGWQRYLLCVFPALALLAAHGLKAFPGRWAAPVLGVLAILPGLTQSALRVRELTLPDTRALSQDWIEENVPVGAMILLDQVHAGPRLLMNAEQSAELAAKAETAGSPRARLFRGMTATHPGGGYRLLRIQRSAKDLWTSPELVERSQADNPTLDVRAGLDPARAMRVEYVVTSGVGATPQRSPELHSFFTELQRQGQLLSEFIPRPGETTGPVIRVWRLHRKKG